MEFFTYYFNEVLIIEFILLNIYMLQSKQTLYFIIALIVIFILGYFSNKWLNGNKQIEKFDNSGPAKYKITFVSDWGSDQQKINFPANPHTGNMFLITNNGQVQLFDVGTNASTAISNTAMFGTINDLQQLYKYNTNVGTIATNPVLMTPGKSSFFIDVYNDKPYLSFVTMVAPSPDWFTGTPKAGVNLLAQNDWVKNISVPLYVYDAGTDSGQGFNTEHYIQNQPNPVTIKTDTFLYPDGLVKPIAYLQIDRIN